MIKINIIGKFSLVMASAAGVLFTILFCTTAWAQSDRTTRLQEIEGIFGITASYGAVGDGKLTAQISQEGTITCLRWPNATYYEHVNYAAGTWDQDPQKNAYRLPHWGAADNAGIFAGILTETVDGSRHLRWLRDGTRTAQYANDDANRLVVTYDFGNGLVVEESTFVPVESGALIRSYTLISEPPSVVQSEIYAYSNFALRDDYGPGYDPREHFTGDDEPRFAAFAVPEEQAILDTLPASKVQARQELEETLTTLSDADAVADFVAESVLLWKQGVYVAQGLSKAWLSFQVGNDRSSLPQDAWLNAADGSLSQSSWARDYPNAVMSAKISTGKPVAWYAAFATLPAQALNLLQDLRSQKIATAEAASDNWWQDWLSGARLPSDPRAKTFAKRALISLRTGYDPVSGAIVASTSCQPPYNLDWPRDGAFFQYVLDINGLDEMADRHARFYAPLNNEKHLIAGPLGSWAMNTYADGVPGGPIGFEIDQVGFVLWLYRSHAAFVAATDRQAAREFVLAIEPSMRRAADLLLSCRDDSTGLPCPANEDDHPEFTQTLHGAATVWLGLTGAAELYRALGPEFHAYATTIEARAEEIKIAMHAQLPESLLDEQEKGSFWDNNGALGWSFWPGGFWSAEEATVVTEARSKFIDILDQHLLREADGSSYDTKLTIALLTSPLRSADTEAYVKQIHELYLDEVLSEAGHLGEGTVHDDFNGDGTKTWRNITATPHIWAQSLLYLSLLAAEDPTILNAPKLPDLAPEPIDIGPGCSCTIGSTGNPFSVLPIFILLAFGIHILRRSKNPQR